MRQPFFIVGSGRSGSTLLYRLLAEHQNVALTNEGRVADFLDYCSQWAAVPQYEARSFPLWTTTELHGLVRDEYQDAFGRVFHRHARAALEEFYVEQFPDRDFTHWGDKLPIPQVAVELQFVYPEARYIVLVRDARDVCCSLLAYRERDALRGTAFLRDQSIEDFAKYWANAYRAFRTYLDHHHVVRYEDLIRDPESTLRGIFTFLDLEGVDDVLARADDASGFAEHATADSPALSIDRWQRELTREQVESIESICGAEMRIHGYRTAAEERSQAPPAAGPRTRSAGS